MAQSFWPQSFNTQRECRLPIGILRVMRQGGRLNNRSGEPKCRTRSSSSLELEVKPSSSLDFANRGSRSTTVKPALMTEQASSPQRERSSVVVKVLYIEDNDDDVYMLKMRLELLGNFEVLTAADGEKGCAVAAAEQPDIILMDVEMPVVDGWEAARRLKGNSQTQDIPIIALSAHALAGEREKAIATGCEEFDT